MLALAGTVTSEFTPTAYVAPLLDSAVDLILLHQLTCEHVSVVLFGQSGEQKTAVVTLMSL